MKISELIKELEDQKNHSGDIEVFIQGSNRIYLDPLPYYYDGGGAMLIDGKWYSTKYNSHLCGDTILHLCSITFEFGLDGEEWYDGVKFEAIEEPYEENLKLAKQKYYKTCRHHP